MRVLLTGAFGNVGSSARAELLRRGHQLTCFDVRTPANVRAARQLPKDMRVIWGDIRRPADVAEAVAGQDVVIHLAFVIPKLSATGTGSEDRPDWSRSINVDGTRNLIEAMSALPHPPRLIFASSLHIYGPTQDQEPPRVVGDPLNPTEHYSRHKVACEELVRGSALEWSILRFAAAMPIALQPDAGMFDVPLANRMEFVHTHDVGLALANAVESEEIWGRILHIGGGPRCQLYFREIAEKALTGMGVGMLPDEAFAAKQFCTDWLDTRESQALLNYQVHTYDDFVADMRARLGWRRPLVRLFRPWVRAWLLGKSPYYLPALQAKEWEGRVAVVTGASAGIGAATARALAARKMRLVLVARREDRLEALAEEIRASGGQALVVPADLTDEEQCRRVIETTLTAYGAIDVLVNGAGLGWYGRGSEMPWSVAREMMRVNVEAMVRLTLLALPRMCARGAGHIVNIGSVVGSLPSQGVAVYSASKAFAGAFSTALHRETAGSGVHISVLDPGPVLDTEFYALADVRPAARRMPGRRFAISPEVVAERVWGLLARPRRVAYVPRVLAVVPWIELFCGWIMDRIGPLLLKRDRSSGQATA